MSCSETSTLQPSAAKRLVRDLRQLHREAVPSSCAAAPASEDDMAIWHFSLTSTEGPFLGCIFHGVLTFPDDYPSNPPTVKLCTGLPGHPNVYDGYDYNRGKSDSGHFICLNMLRPPQGAHHQAAYSGWSSAYSVHALLMQLSSFLFAENIPQDYGGSVRNREDESSIRRGREQALAFHAQHGAKFPPLPLAAVLQEEAARPLEFSEPTSCTTMHMTSRFFDTQQLMLSEDGLGIRHSSQNVDNPTSNWALVKADRSLPPSESFYFEVTLETFVPRVHHVRIGLVAEGPAGSNSELGMGQGQWGFDDSGGRYHSGNKLRNCLPNNSISTLPNLREGDTVGVLVRRSCGEPNRHVTCLCYSLNGHELGELFQLRTSSPLSAALSIRSESRRHQVCLNHDSFPPAQLFVNFGRFAYEFPPTWTFAKQHERQLAATDRGDVLTDHTNKVDVSIPTDNPDTVSLSQLSIGGGERACENKGSGLRKCSSGVCLCAALGIETVPRADQAHICGTTVSSARGAICRKSEDADPFAQLPEDAVLQILSYLEPEHLNSARSTNYSLCVVMYRWNVWERREVICFHSKLSFQEDVLGVGCSVEFHGRSQDIKSVHPQLDLLSKSSFENGVRRGVWGEKFDRWLPLWICDQHGQRAWPHILATVHSLACRRAMDRAPVAGHSSHLSMALAERYLSFLGKCMNSFCVSMMQWEEETTVQPKHPSAYSPDDDDDDMETKPNTTLASERALSGYCAYHHLLLVFCSKYPAMRKAADALVDAMLAGKGDKSVVPDIGILLACLTVTSRTWADSAVAWAIVGESLDRNVFWFLKHKQIPTLLDLEKPPSSIAKNATNTVHQLPGGYEANELGERAFLADWWRYSLTSKRVLMFQAYFIRHVGRPNGAHPSTVLQHYNRSLGRASPRMVSRLQHACTEIDAVQSWPGYFERLGLPCPQRAQVLTRLRSAVVNSRHKGYHGLLPGQTQRKTAAMFTTPRRPVAPPSSQTQSRGRNPARLLTDNGRTLRQLGLRR